MEKARPYLASVKGIRPFDFSEVHPEPVLGERVLILCLGKFLMANADTRYLRTIDVARQEQLSAVKVFGAPVKAWQMDPELIAVNLYGSDFGFMALIFKVKEQRVGRKIAYYSGTTRFGQTAIVLVQASKGALLENYSQAHLASLGGSYNLSLFDLLGVGEGKMLKRGCPANELRAFPVFERGYRLSAADILVTGKLPNGETVKKRLAKCTLLMRALLNHP